MVSASDAAGYGSRAGDHGTDTVVSASDAGLDQGARAFIWL
jgi:hypothetical protein